MSNFLKQSTAVVVSYGPFLDKTDGVTLETGLVSSLDNGTTGIFLSKNGGTLTIRHATVTASSYDSYGNYKVTLDTTDTNTLGTLRMQFSEAATCLPVWQDFMVVPANVWDSMFGASLLKVDVDTIKTNPVVNGGTITFPTTATLASTTNITAGTVTTATNVTTVNGLAAGVITATSIANDAITDAKVASDVTIASVTGAVGSVTGAVGSVTGAVGSVTGNVGGNVTGTVGSVVGAVGSVTGAVGSVTGNVGGNVVGTVASVVGAVGSVAGNVGGNVVGSVASVTDVTTIADGLLKRDMSAVTGESARSPLNALRFLRNKWAISAGTLSVKKEDDATEAWSASVSTDASADPIIGNDPA